MGMHSHDWGACIKLEDTELRMDHVSITAKQGLLPLKKTRHACLTSKSMYGTFLEPQVAGPALRGSRLFASETHAC